ncbi:MAG TPA: VWA domain-containing protein [Thermoleophilaceae bacterium]|nr:VWA domain-containing protein [Thermoleophilaceae bacterium]
MPERLGARLTGKLTLLAASMRAAGVRVGVGELLSAHRALGAVDPADRDAAYFALRATLCSRHEDLLAFDAAFAEWFRPAPLLEAPPPPALDEAARLALPRTAVPSQARPLEVEGAEEVVPSAWSDVELLRDKDFADYSDQERRVARRVMRRLAAVTPERPSRRTRPARRRGAAPPAARMDLRGTMRASLRTGGDPFERHWREPGQRPRQLVLVCDVSGSMEPYARMLLAYMQACVAARRRVEAFVFGTRLTRVTAELRGRDPDAALARAAGAVQDWSGGTRIGDALATLNREHGRRIGRGAVVVLLSDGWDRGDPAQLEREISRLARCSHRLIWLNPLKAHPDYEPLTRGMRAALPFVDEFMAGNSLASLEELAEALDRLSSGRLVRGEGA